MKQDTLPVINFLFGIIRLSLLYCYFCFCFCTTSSLFSVFKLLQILDCFRHSVSINISKPLFQSDSIRYYLNRFLFYFVIRLSLLYFLFNMVILFTVSCFFVFHFSTSNFMCLCLTINL